LITRHSNLGGLAGALSKFEITVVLEGTEGSSKETRSAVQYFKFGNGASNYETMQDQMEAGVTISESDLSFIKHGHSPAVSFEPGVWRYRVQPTSVVVEIFDDDGKRIEGPPLDDDNMSYALTSLIRRCPRVPGPAGVDALTIPKQYHPGRREDEVWDRPRLGSRRVFCVHETPTVTAGEGSFYLSVTPRSKRPARRLLDVSDAIVASKRLWLCTRRERNLSPTPSLNTF
jgi:hypothetical protein